MPEQTKSKSQLLKTARQTLGISAKTVVGLMPGSRRSEFNALLPTLLESAQRLFKSDSNLQFVLPFAKPNLRTYYQAQILESGLPILMLDGNSKQAMQASDVVILASGTAALESMLEQTVMVVIYKVSSLSYLMFKLFAQVKYFSMPNHLLEQPVVPELSQDEVTAENICKQVQYYLDQPQTVKALEAQFATARRQLAIDADKVAARAVLKLLDE